MNNFINAQTKVEIQPKIIIRNLNYISCCTNLLIWEIDDCLFDSNIISGIVSLKNLKALSLISNLPSWMKNDSYHWLKCLSVNGGCTIIWTLINENDSQKEMNKHWKRITWLLEIFQRFLKPV